MQVDEVQFFDEAGNPRAAVEKRLTSREMREPEAVLRLRSEGALLERLGGEATPRVFARGEDERGPFVRLERIAFPTLADRLAERGMIGLDESFVTRAAVAAFDALAILHEAHDDEGPLAIIHADLSVANVIVDDAGARAVLLDLGLSSWRESPPRDGAFRGTLATCAPEIARAEIPTVKSDLYSLAATLLHARTGRAPRTGSSFAALVAAAAETPIVLPEERPAVLALGPVFEVILVCLAHDPKHRPESAREVATLLARC